MQRETWVGIAWAVGLFAAMAAVFVYEAATFELEEFHVTFEETDEGDSATATLSVGATRDYSFQATAQNLTYVEVELTWNDANGGDDQFTLLVADPSGNTTTKSGTGGALVIRFDGVEVPDQDHIEGVDLAHAKQSDLAAPRNADALAGTWMVSVRLDSAPPVASSQPTEPVNGCGAPMQPACDGSNPFTLTWRVVHYSATFPSDDEAHA